jgi:hypothetical protein
VRLTASLDHAEKLLAPTLTQLTGSVALRLDVGLPDHILMLDAHDLDNYALPLAHRLTTTQSLDFVSIWATKSAADTSLIRSETATHASLPGPFDYRVTVRTTASASTMAYKQQVSTGLTDAAELPPGPSTQSRPSADVVLVGCVKSKREHGAPAKDLYVSDYFSKMRGYAEATGLPWFILSAEHGLVRPEDWLEPYERYLPNTSRDYRRAWGEHVAEQLELAVGSLAGLVVDVHAGAEYIGPLEDALSASGARVTDQLKGLSFGRRLSWYLQHPGAQVSNEREVVSKLRDRRAARALSDVLATGGIGLRTPGMYSWWIDEVGAADLTSGLGHQVEAGLVYAGLAGATRSGGSSSSNTLWGRIATMHLGKNHQFSTLRFSVGSILAEANGEAAIDEVELTRWMNAHLRVVAIPVADADTLGDLETAILADLDPPLNLAKVGKTPIRQRLSALRKQYGG